MKKIIVSVFLIALVSTAWADLYLEIGYESGGETLISDTAGYDISAGGGLNYVVGIQSEIGEHGDSLSLALGYMTESISGSNGTAEITSFTIDAIYSAPVKRHRFGAGASYHLDPTYKDDIDGFPSLKIEFDDTLGLVLQYSYAMRPRFLIGARFTDMDYEVNGVSLGADSIGIFLSNGF